MGFRLKENINLGAGTKLNINKKNVSVTTGVKGAHTTFSSTGKRTSTIGIPGSGLSYTKTTSGKHDNKKGCGGGCLTVIILFVLIGVLSSPSDKKDDTTTTAESVMEITTEETTEAVPAEEHFYDNAEVRDVMNGSGTDKIGEYSVLHMQSDELTDELLNDYYFSYFAIHDYNYGIIIYDDNSSMGVYVTSGMLIKDANIVIDSSGDYSYESSENEIVYWLSGDGQSLQPSTTEGTTEVIEPTTEYAEMVWISQSGSKYHKRSTCSNMDNPTEVPRETAEARGYTPCKRCY